MGMVWAKGSSKVPQEFTVLPDRHLEFVAASKLAGLGYFSNARRQGVGRAKMTPDALEDIEWLNTPRQRRQFKNDFSRTFCLVATKSRTISQR